MSHLASNLRLSLIVERISRSPCTYEEVEDYLGCQSELKGVEFKVSKRTFGRDLKNILSFFSVSIIYDKKLRKYKLDEEESVGNIGNRLIEAMNTVHVLSINGVESVMDFQKASIIRPMSLWDLTEAIKKHLVVHFEYSKFYNREEIITYQVDPYRLKEFEHRWYLIGWDKKAKLMKTFGMDRVLALTVTKKSFWPEQIDFRDKYKDCYGIIDDPSLKPEWIELLFEEVQGEYVKSLPLHDSQQVLYEKSGAVGIGLKIKITHDFIMKLLSFGANVEVLQPKALAARIKTAHLEAFELYR